jgi:hypothetical protein
MRSGWRRSRREKNGSDRPKHVLTLAPERIIDRLEAVVRAQSGDGAIDLVQNDQLGLGVDGLPFRASMNAISAGPDPGSSA